MKKIYIVGFILALIALFSVLMIPSTVSYERIEQQPVLPQLSHAQYTWVRALEWCESAGKPEAINPKDLDGTASHGSWQFKESTFEYFKKAYGIVGELMDRSVQYAILVRMVLDPDKISFDKQFPDCVKKLGFPPRK